MYWKNGTKIGADRLFDDKKECVSDSLIVKNVNLSYKHAPGQTA